MAFSGARADHVTRRVVPITISYGGLYSIPLNSRGARVSFGLWILKVKGPTLNLHILNAEVFKSVGILWAAIDILRYFHKT